MNAAGQHARAEGPGPKRVEPLELSVQWQDYDRIAPGVYPAYVRSARTYRDPQYKRWTCLLRFDVLNETLTRTIAHVPFWLNLSDYVRPLGGSRPRRDGVYTLNQPKAGGTYNKLTQPEPT